VTIELIKRSATFSTQTAIIDQAGAYTYEDLFRRAGKIASAIEKTNGRLNGARVAYMVQPGFDYVAALWAIWLADGVAVPIGLSHPAPEIKYVLQNSDAAYCIYSAQRSELLAPILNRQTIQPINLAELPESEPFVRAEDCNTESALILYTSGTTGKPKGVELTHANISFQIKSLVEAWEWRKDDQILCVLPLHHTHGIVNVLCCALWCGATCRFLPKFDAEDVWQSFINNPLTLFMAVPTIYHRLIDFWEKSNAATQKKMSKACSKFRLMVSGSAALPATTLNKWFEISAQTLLERYGMTEIGMALSNPLHGERKPGWVGAPLPGVQARIIDENNKILPEGRQGELQIKSPNVFKEYWQCPEATKNAFWDGWFKTGDIVVREENNYRIIGRSSVDIIKTGGYKVSALEIEATLLEHHLVMECAVTGAEDADLGEVICAAVKLKGEISAFELNSWLKTKLAPYKTPRKLIFTKNIPRNAMGKVNKAAVKRLFTK